MIVHNATANRNRILLIRPPMLMKGTSFIASQFPLNIASIASGLLNAGYDVRIWDFDVEAFEETAFQKKLKDLNPSIVGISCYTPTIINGHRIASIVKKLLPEALTIVGGPHVSALAQETMDEFTNFDIGVIGEGEEVVLEIVEKKSRGETLQDTAGIIYRKDGMSRIAGKSNPVANLDQLVFPARHLLNIPLYKGQSHRGFSRSFLKITEIFTSRGCPNRCIFCATDVVTGGGVRFRSSDSVKHEIAECVERYGFNHFNVMDDTFTLKEGRLYEICDEFSRRRLTWNCYGRVWPLSKKMLTTLARSGCIGMTFGVESGSPRILKLIKKNITLEQIEDAFRWAKEAGIKLVEADVIIGSHPSETKEDINMTKKLLTKISPDIIMASVIVPYPGTELYGVMREKNLIFKDRSWDSFILFGRKPSWRTENFGPDELVSLQKKMMLDFYFRPFYILRMLSKMKSLREVAYWLRGGRDFLTDCLKGYFKRNKAN